MATLWIFFPDRQQKLELDDNPVTIGRVDGNTVCVDEPTVSKIHARIVKDHLGWLVEDLGSSNGTWLEGERIESARLVAGARLKIGRAEFVLDDIQIENDNEADFQQHGSIMTSVPSVPPGLFDAEGNIRENLLVDKDQHPRAEQQTKESVEEQKLRLIGTLGEALIDVTKWTAVAAKILEIITKEIQADRGFVCVFQEDGTFLPLASHGVKPEEPVRLSRTLLETMRQEKVGVLVRQTDTESNDFASLKAMNVQSTVYVPLWALNRIMGFLALDLLHSRRSFSRRHLDLLIAVSHQAALGLERARLAETAERERKRRDYLGQYLDHKLLQRLIQSSEDGPDPLAPREQTVTVLFCDIVSFTKMSECLSPTDIAKFVRDHMTLMTEILFAHEGTVDKYIGDAVMALFGAPVQTEAAPANAVRAALTMRERVGQIDGQPIRLRFGISTGSAVVGNIGSAQRREYTAIGDSVNVASRLEGFSRPGEIVIDESTRETLGDGFLVEEIGTIDVRNRVQPVSVFRVLGES